MDPSLLKSIMLFLWFHFLTELTGYIYINLPPKFTHILEVIYLQHIWHTFYCRVPSTCKAFNNLFFILIIGKIKGRENGLKEMPYQITLTGIKTPIKQGLCSSHCFSRNGAQLHCHWGKVLKWKIIWDILLGENPIIHLFILFTILFSFSVEDNKISNKTVPQNAW